MQGSAADAFAGSAGVLPLEVVQAHQPHFPAEALGVNLEPERAYRLIETRLNSKPTYIRNRRENQGHRAARRALRRAA